MITIQFCDKSMTVDASLTLSELLIKNGYTQNHFAVAINQCFISRNNYQQTILTDGDKIDVVTPMQGG